MARDYQKPHAKAGRMTKPQFIACGENALIIILGDGLDNETNSLAVALENHIQAQKWDYLLEAAPLLRSVFVRYDVQQVDFARVVADIEALLPSFFKADGKAEKADSHRLWHLPICYEGEYAPDCENLARLMDLSVAEMVALHVASELRVLMLGFAPGWIYGGLLSEIWDVPRLSAAKPDVAAGSISVAVRQVIISATVAPTGWRTIGRTPYLNFDLRREEVFTMGAGDRINIEKITAREFTLLEKEFAAGVRQLSYEAVG